MREGGGGGLVGCAPCSCIVQLYDVLFPLILCRRFDLVVEAGTRPRTVECEYVHAHRDGEPS